jgi:hypothetical protein
MKIIILNMEIVLVKPARKTNEVCFCSTKEVEPMNNEIKIVIPKMANIE